MTFIQINDKSLYINQKSYFEKLKNQLSKDLNDDDVDLQLKQIPLNKSHGLLLVVKQFLNKTFTNNSNLFFQLMHRIDIPDVDLKVQFTDLGNDFESLADLVLRRELLKVLIREKYSQ